MKEDILEQIADDYLQACGYFTRHNLKFRPDSAHCEYVAVQDRNYSDIDVIGINPKITGPNRVWVISCKSWQAGFDVRSKLNEITHNKIRSKREAWQFFRELVKPKWAEAFRAEVLAATGETSFTYITAVTKIRGEANEWENHPLFVKQMAGNPIRLVSLQHMIETIQRDMTTTVESSQLGRTLQLIRAAGASLTF